jgi:hypothetical protein
MPVILSVAPRENPVHNNKWARSRRTCIACGFTANPLREPSAPPAPHPPAVGRSGRRTKRVRLCFSTRYTLRTGPTRKAHPLFLNLSDHPNKKENVILSAAPRENPVHNNKWARSRRICGCLSPVTPRIPGTPRPNDPIGEGIRGTQRRPSTAQRGKAKTISGTPRAESFRTARDTPRTPDCLS